MHARTHARTHTRQYARTVRAYCVTSATDNNNNNNDNNNNNIGASKKTHNEEMNVALFKPRHRLGALTLSEVAVQLGCSEACRVVRCRCGCQCGGCGIGGGRRVNIQKKRGNTVAGGSALCTICLLYTSPSPRDRG